MSIIEKLKILIQEVCNLIVNFFKPVRLEDEILRMPDNLKEKGFKTGVLALGMTITALVFAFLLKATNMLVEERMIVLAIICFMLYHGQEVLRDGFEIYKTEEQNKFHQEFENQIAVVGSIIIGKVSNKVVKYNENMNIYQLMRNEEILNVVKTYLDNAWSYQIRHMFEVLEIASVIIMLIVAVMTNNAIDQTIFISLVVGFSVLAFLSAAYNSISNKVFRKNYRRNVNERDVVLNDLLRTPIIVGSDLEMRISKFKQALEKSNDNWNDYRKKQNYSNLLITIVQTIAQYGIIVFYGLSLNLSTITLATIAEITATLVIVERAIRYICRITRMLNDSNSRIISIEKEIDDMKLILEVYHDESRKADEERVIENLHINPFAIKYIEESENDKPFTLVSENEININKGEIAVLYGASGSGKSTFMKLLTERIRVEKSTEIPATNRFLMYDENLRFGSLSIFEELFCGQEPNFAKMQEILENLHLWVEIKSNCHDVWQWMKEKKFDNSLSNGQKQRIILAKLLYWLNDKVDVMVLDEPTSGLDDKCEEDSADAERILEYIVRYVNSDKKRIIIISTHQNIEGFKAKLASNYVFRNLQFKKRGEINKINELN